MPPALKAQAALIGLLAVLLIPIGTSSLRGLTHILTCKDESATPFSVTVLEDGPPVVLSAAVARLSDEGTPPTREVCGGLVLDLQAGSREKDRALMVLTIINNTEHGWRGSVHLDLAGTSLPVDIGHVDAGGREQDTLEIRLEQGRTYEITGSLLIGP